MMLQFPRTVIFADDLTGALEMGVLARQTGHRAVVCLDGGHVLPEQPAVHTVVMDCGNRELPEADAIAALERFAERVPEWPDLAILKKTDSLLRGHIAAELAFLRARYPQRRLVYVPAYPLLGRRVRGGKVRMVADSREVDVGDVMALLGAAIPQHAIALMSGPLELEQALAGGGGTVLVCDGESQDAVDAMGQILRRWVQNTIIAGPAGVFRTLFPLGAGLPAKVPRIPCGVGFLGSVHPVSSAQWEALHASDRALLRDATASHAEGYRQALAEAGESGRWLMLRAQPAKDAAPSMEFHPLPEALFLSGGATAAACLHLLGCHQLEPLRELEPGVVLSEAHLDGRLVRVVTKSGAFGDSQTLVRILAMLQEGSPSA